MANYKAVADEQLVSLYIAGQNEAFDELLFRYQDKLYSYILFYVKNRDLADDLFQETFVRAIVALQKGAYRESCRFYYWLTRIAHNLLIDQVRFENNEALVYKDESEDGWNGVRGLLELNREDQLNNEQVLRDVRTLMDLLPKEQHDVVFMRIYQEMSFKEIAETTGVSINTALGRFRYGVSNMRRMAEKRQISLVVE